MTRTEYLYGVRPDYFDGLEFYEALEQRMQLGKELKFDLVRVRNEPYTKRVEDIEGAIEWCNGLLSEKETK